MPALPQIEQVRENHARLAEPAKLDDVTVFSAHDPVELERLSTRPDF